MKKRKIFNILLGVIISFLAIACAVHTAAAYINISSDKFTSCPADVAFLIIIPYAFAIIIAVVVCIALNVKADKRSA